MNKKEKTNCITFYSKNGCAPCDVWYKILVSKYQGCYEKITIETESEVLEVLNSFKRKTVPFIVEASGKVLTDKEFEKFMFSILRSI